MMLHSTNGQSSKVSLSQGITNGIAPDGGLYMPDELPRLPKAFFNNIAEMSLHDIAFVVMNMLFGDILSSTVLKRIVSNALNFDIPLRQLAPNKYVLELFHGPTKSFKDVGARFMAYLMDAFDAGKRVKHDILLATSGDSGGAVANAFAKSSNTRVCVVFPGGELSREQLSQFLGIRNVLAIEVEGSFDDCQHLVKEALRTGSGSHNTVLTSGNSINLARELPSLIYFFHTYARIVERHGVDCRSIISIPCGNLGSFCAALMAKEMGLPVEKFFAANNANDVFVEYLKTGGFRPQRALLTLARAMDVGNPSNIARIIDLYKGDTAKLRGRVDGYSYNDEEIAQTMRDTYDRYGYIVDPQSATALRAIDRHLPEGYVGVALASADPCKSDEALRTVFGNKIPQIHAVELPHRHPANLVKIPPNLSALNRALNRQ